MTSLRWRPVSRPGWMVGTGLALAAGIVGGSWGWARPLPPLPSVAEVRAAYRPSDVTLLDRHGEALHETRVDAGRRRLAWTPLADVSPALQKAVIASEDRRFATHGGVDVRALGAAAVQSLTGGAPRGGSTLTMQLVGLLDRNLRRRGGPRTLGQKWHQARLAWRLEATWTKADILEAYLNLVPFRGEVEGVHAAARVLFDKAPHGLTDAEATVLAVLLRSPNADPPAVTRRAARLQAVLDLPVETDAVRAAVLRVTEPPAGGERRSGVRVADAPHAARLLLATLGPDSWAPPAAGDVVSTLDAGVQRMAADTLRRHLLAVRERHVQDGAVLVVDNGSDDVLAYVGGSGDLASRRHVDGVQARRQAGSTLKPFLYALALESRLLTPASRLLDAPLELPVAGALYRPRNYDERFAGAVSVRTALAASLNVPAVRTLEMLSPEAFASHLRRLGFAGVTEPGDYYGPALALGSADVSLWELVSAYRALAEGGVWRPLRLRPGAVTVEGGEASRALQPASVFLVSDILSHRESRSPTFGLENPLATRFWTAVKTGTSKDMRDNWAVGFSRRYTVGVWVGNFSGAPMRDVSGITGAAPVWRDVMTWLHREQSSVAPAPPPGVVMRDGEWFLVGTEPAGAVAAAAGLPRIVAPTSGTIVALDPDIPPDRQRLVFEAAAGGGVTRWQLDGVALSAVGSALVWAPTPGSHLLVLLDERGRALDEVVFEVRGSSLDRAATDAD